MRITDGLFAGKVSPLTIMINATYLKAPKDLKLWLKTGICSFSSVASDGDLNPCSMQSPSKTDDRRASSYGRLDQRSHQMFVMQNNFPTARWTLTGLKALRREEDHP